mmetsp:Transcript_29324/g.56999  ORF Transcript_29324/g.56999 Transcript_29324/m.56999 type:complete len:155 (-) Transcript_29324:1523-1987(-)
MIARWAQPGAVVWLGLRPARRAEMDVVEEVEIDAAGLVGDRSRPGKRAVTLIQAEHLSAIGAFLGQGPVDPALLRRNIVVSGLNLASMKDRHIAIGDAVLHLTVICAPCSRMEETFGHGGYAAVRSHGGWCAEVVRPGRVRFGDAVRPLDEGAD